MHGRKVIMVRYSIKHVAGNEDESRLVFVIESDLLDRFPSLLLHIIHVQRAGVSLFARNDSEKPCVG